MTALPVVRRPKRLDERMVEAEGELVRRATQMMEEREYEKTDIGLCAAQIVEMCRERFLEAMEP